LTPRSQMGLAALGRHLTRQKSCLFSGLELPGRAGWRGSRPSALLGTGDIVNGAGAIEVTVVSARFDSEGVPARSEKTAGHLGGCHERSHRECIVMSTKTMVASATALAVSIGITVTTTSPSYAGYYGYGNNYYSYYPYHRHHHHYYGYYGRGYGNYYSYGYGNYYRHGYGNYYRHGYGNYYGQGYGNFYGQGYGNYGNGY
jgi:hypothetical protein